MDILTHINNCLQDKPRTMLLYSILIKYDHNEDDINCFECLNEIIKKIEHNKSLYLEYPSKELNNEIENDLITMEDLVDEFKEHVYPLFKVNLLSLFLNYQYQELFYINDYLNNNLKEESKLLLDNNIDELCKELNIMPMVKSNYDKCLMDLKDLVRFNQLPIIKELHLRVIASYFNYQVGK